MAARATYNTLAKFQVGADEKKKIITSTIEYSVRLLCSMILYVLLAVERQDHGDMKQTTKTPVRKQEM